jgi:hypothetical protein
MVGEPLAKGAGTLPTDFSEINVDRTARAKHARADNDIEEFTCLSRS